MRGGIDNSWHRVNTCHPGFIYVNNKMCWGREGGRRGVVVVLEYFDYSGIARKVI